ncbi:MAG: 16S rRNA (guanine(966)-N(2))-methyltransferase RsmD [Sphingomonadaceae bacterium]
MRIISGKWRSRPLATAAGEGTRPTADRVRETLFSMLLSRLGSFEGLAVLDLFAGSGALAFEALSRGAERAWLVEQDREARAAITANIRALAANATLIGHDATALPVAPAAADLIFLDPPYHSGLATPALARARAQGWIQPSTWISIETAREENPEVPETTTETVRAVGKAALHLLRPA